MKKSLHPFHILKEVFDLLPDAVIVVDHHGQIMMYNNEFSKLLGYNQEELLSKPLDEIIPTQYRAGHTQHVTQFFEKREARKMAAGFRLKALHKKRSEIPVDIALSPYEVDKSTYAIAVIRELSDKLYYEEKIGSLERMKEELERFACVVSHDLKAPVKRIHILVDLILGELPEKPGENLQMLVNYLQQSIALTERLIEGILEQARTEYGKQIELLDLNAIVEDAKKGLSIPSNFVIEIAGPLPRINGNPTQWIQVFMNLITNAIKFNGKPQGLLRISATIEDNRHKISFADNGSVVPVEKRKAIFDLFVRGESRTQESSHGIGLSIVKKVVENGGGEIVYCESDLGGSEFIVYWPV
jgi:PAS domain S-box-containing protein